MEQGYNMNLYNEDDLLQDVSNAWDPSLGYYFAHLPSQTHLPSPPLDNNSLGPFQQLNDYAAQGHLEDSPPLELKQESDSPDAAESPDWPSPNHDNYGYHVHGAIARDPEPWWENPEDLMKPLRPRVEGEALSNQTCLRCRAQKLKCEVEAGIQTSCAACNALHRARSKKTEHWMPCIQPSFKLNTMVTYRAGNLRLTSRFDHTRMVDVPRARNLPFAQAPVFATIRMTQQYLCVQPMTLRVHYFDPLDTDKLHREYVNRGVPGVQRLPPVSLCDIVETSMEFMRYVRAGALDGITLAAQKPDSNPTIRHIFSIIPQHLNMLEDQEEKNFLTGVIQHWFAAMHGLGSATLCPGPEGNALNIIPINDYMPKFGLISVPRMIVAQFDSIRFATMFKGAQHQILDRLQSKLLFNGKPQWFTVFLATFLILNIVSCSSRDRYRYVRENSQGHRLETRYGELNDPGTKNVEDLHQSAALLLAHWNYFRRADFGGKMRGKGIASMEQHERQIIERLKTEVENQAGQIEKNPVTGFWESDLGWVSCMFAPPGTAGNSWLPPPIFDRAKPSVGRMDEIPLDQRPMPVGWL